MWIRWPKKAAEEQVFGKKFRDFEKLSKSSDAFLTEDNSSIC